VNPRPDPKGWQVSELATWLYTQGASDWSLQALIERVGDRLVGLGAPLYRMRISFRTLHPQVTARSGLWLRGHPVTTLRVSRETELSDAFVGSPIQQVIDHGTPLRRRLRDLDAEMDHAVLHEIRAEGGTDYLALPVTVGARTVGVVTLVSDRADGFDDAEVERLQALVQVLTPFLQAISMRDIARSLLDTYLGPRTGERVLSGKVQRGDGEIIEAAMWFSDLRDFTPLTESLPPQRLLGMLNAYFELVAAAVTARGGEILRFIGDAMLIVFPVTPSTSARAACESALEGARDAYASLATLNHRRRRSGEPEIRFGVGLHVGEAVYGNVGAPDRLDFTVMGPAVNRTARLESLTKTLGPPLLMSGEFAAQVDTPTRSLGAHAMKGVATPQAVFALEEEL
jgi:adenylate cyclase